MQQLDDSNFMLYAAANYDNPQLYDTDEFYDDLKRFKYLKRLFNRYKETGELKERLILNHLIVIYNHHCYILISSGALIQVGIKRINNQENNRVLTRIKRIIILLIHKVGAPILLNPSTSQKYWAPSTSKKEPWSPLDRLRQ